MGQSISSSTSKPGPLLDRFGQLLLAWQEDQKQDALERLLSEAESLITSVARRTLQATGLDSPNFVDDTLSLVSNHLRRLPPQDTCGHSIADPVVAAGERTVQPFFPRPHDEAAGIRFLTWLTQRRAADVIRRAKRRRKVISNFSEHSDARIQRAETAAAERQFQAERTEATRNIQLAWVYEKLDELPHDDRLLMDLSLAGKSLSVIAHVLGCCEGTVCRRRQRIENWLRENAPPPVPSGGLRKHHRPPAVNEDPILKDHPDRPGEDELLDVPPRLGHPIG